MEEANRGYPIRVRGVVTFFDPVTLDLFIQDSTAGIWIDLGGTHPALKAGQLLEVEGISSAPDFAPQIAKPRFHVLGTASLPVARPVTYSRMASTEEDSQWVEVEGMVHSAEKSGDALLLDVAMDAGRLTVRISNFPGPAPASLVDSKVRIDGACGAIFNQKNQIMGVALYSPSFSQVHIFEPAAADPFLTPLLPMAGLLRFNPLGSSGHRVRVKGTVTLQQPGASLFISDGGRSLYVHTRQATPVQVGDWVEAVGFPAAGEYSAVLQDAVFRRVGAGPLPSPATVTAAQAVDGSHDAAFVSIAAKLLEKTLGNHPRTLNMEAGNTVFRALLDDSLPVEDLEDLAPGSLLRLNGICIVHADENHLPQSFQILIRSLDGVVLLQPPSWWSIKHLVITISLLVAVVLGFIVWTTVLNRRVRAKTMVIREGLRREIASRERYQELFENASDIVFTCGLGGHITSFNRAGEQLLKRTREAVIGRHIGEILAPDPSGRVKDLFDKELPEGSPRTLEVDLLSEDGKQVPVEVSVRPIRNDGYTAGWQAIARDITERRRAEEALRQAELKYRGIFENAVEGIFQSTRDGRQISANPGLVRMFGYDSPGEMISSLTDLARIYVDPQRRTFFKQVLEKQGELRGFESEVYRKDGSVIWISENARTVRDESGNIAYYEGTVEDITERKRAEKVQACIYEISEAAHSAPNLQELFRPIHTVISKLMPAKNFYIALYDSITDTLSFPYFVDEYDEPPAPKKPGKGLTEYVLRTEKPLLAPPAVFEALLNTGEVETIGAPSIDWLGVPLKVGDRTFGVLVVQSYSEGVRFGDDEKTILTFVSDQVATAIERKRIEETVRESERRYRSLFEGANDAILVFEPENEVILEANRHACETYGYEKSELIGMSLKKLTKNVSRGEQQIAEVLQHGTLENFETVHFRKDGTEIHILASSSVIDYNGRTAILSAQHDITAKVRVEQALQKANEMVKAVIEGSPVAILVLDPDGIVRMWNPSAEQMFGWREQEVLGSPLPIVPEESEEEFKALRERAMRGEPVSDVELRRRKKDGSWIDLSLCAAPLRDTSGQAVGLLAILTDITQRRRLEEQLRQAQKMEAVGRLAGGVAHDFNNLLTVISGFGQLVLGRLEPSDPRHHHMSEVVSAADRAAGLTRQLLAFSRRQILEPAVLDLNVNIANAATMLRRMLGEDIELTIVPGEGLGRVKADPGEIDRAILNLAVNARDAMPEGGRLTLRTENISLDELYSRTHYSVPPGEYVLLSVSDTGCGIDAETQKHIFEPFFTTKEPGKGTGLGLAAVHGIIDQSGGHIRLYSQPGMGTCFKIYLPRVDALARPIQTTPVREEQRRGSETILLVEDEAMVRDLALEVLKDAGYTVIPAERPDEALKISDQNQGLIDLLLTDVVMPGMNGPELADRLKVTRPEIKVLYVSGYAADALLRHGPSHSKSAFLQKPFAPAALVRKVREALTVEGDPPTR